MGNRAVITTAPFDPSNIGIYVHWNGGQESVEGFLMACRKLEYRSPETDDYGMARLCEAIGIYFGGALSVGVNRCDNLDCDNGDNGVWLIGNDWQLVDASANPEPEKSQAICDLIVRRIAAAAAVID